MVAGTPKKEIQWSTRFCVFITTAKLGINTRTNFMINYCQKIITTTSRWVCWNHMPSFGKLAISCPVVLLHFEPLTKHPMLIHRQIYTEDPILMDTGGYKIIVSVKNGSA